MATTDGFALVTGTTSGIGASVVAHLLERGWTVAGIARRAASVSHPRYHHLAADLGDVGSFAEIEQRIAGILRDAKWSRVGLVNNAATEGQLGPVERIDPAGLMKLYAVNVVAPVWCMGVIARLTAADVPLRIVNVSSGAAVHAVAGLAKYGSSKAALRMAGMVLAAEWTSPVPHAPVRSDAAILSYEPGVVDTAMQMRARETGAEKFPWVDLFHSFKRNGIIVPAEAPAAEIVAFLESAKQPAFAERRLGGG